MTYLQTLFSYKIVTFQNKNQNLHAKSLIRSLKVQ